MYIFYRKGEIDMKSNSFLKRTAAAVTALLIVAGSVQFDGFFNNNLFSNVITVSAASGAEIFADYANQTEFYLNTIDDLKAFADFVNSGNDFLNKKVYLNDDIKEPFTKVIGDGKYNYNTQEYTKFKGTFDGCGYTVNLAINSNSNYVALFGYTDGATICNVVVTGFVKGNSTMGSIGGVTCRTNIYNCINYADISDGSMLGGITGYVDTASVINCVNYGKVSSNKSSLSGIGGICGFSNVKNTSHISNCANFGEVQSSTSGSDRIGGVFGYDYLNGVSLENCFNAGKVSISSQTIFGKIGSQKNCYYDSSIADSGNGTALSTDLCKGDGSGSLYEKLNANVTEYNQDNSSEIPWASWVSKTDNYPELIRQQLFGFYEERSKFYIDSIEDLNEFASLVNEGKNFKDKTVYLNADISDTFTEVIGISEQNSFQGTFNGLGHTITLAINKNSNIVGLFGYAKNATIKNVTVNGSVKGYNQVGGICGKTFGSIINNCINEAEINGTDYVGGICGWNTESSIVVNCYNKGNVSGSMFFGGLCGQVYVYSALYNSVNAGTVASTGSYRAAITGGMDISPKVENCYNIGTAPVIVVGRKQNGEVKNCYYDSTICASDENGTGLSTENCQGNGTGSLFEKLNANVSAYNMSKNPDEPAWLLWTAEDNEYPVTTVCSLSESTVTVDYDNKKISVSFKGLNIPESEYDVVYGISNSNTVKDFPVQKGVYYAFVTADPDSEICTDSTQSEPICYRAKITEDIINNIGTVIYTDECKAKIDDARSSFDDLDNDEAEYVLNKSVLLSAESKYKVLDVIDKIGKIGDVEYSSVCKAKIDDARNTYDSLNNTEKEDITNYQILEEAEVLYQEISDVISAVDNIGFVEYTSDCKDKIDTARSSYDSFLSGGTNRENLIINYSVLTSAESLYEEIGSVISKIDTIGNFEYTDSYKEKTDTARKAYDTFVSGGTNREILITNYSVLTEAEKCYDVVSEINSIGSVEYTSDCKGKIDAARNAYDTFVSGGNDREKMIVNYSVLTSAETLYEEIETVISKIDLIGDFEYTDSFKKNTDTARKAYDTFINGGTDREKLIINYSVLAEAEEYYKVVSEINEIVNFEYTDPFKKKIETARSSYNSYVNGGSGRKELITNYYVLEYAENLYSALEAKNKAEEERDQAVSDKEDAEEERDQAIQAKDSAEAAAEEAKAAAAKEVAAAKTAQAVAEKAAELAAAAQKTAEEKAEAAETEAEAAKTAQAVAEKAAELAATAQKTAEERAETAETEAAAAKTAKAVAEEKTVSAVYAKETAEKAKINAENAKTAAEQAQAEAEEALELNKKDAAEKIAAANTAAEKARTAQAAAEKAREIAEIEEASAKAAQEAAEKAQALAETEEEKAKNDQKAAEEAQAEAEKEAEIANTVKETAETAAKDAKAAQKTAEEKAETAEAEAAAAKTAQAVAEKAAETAAAAQKTAEEKAETAEAEAAAAKTAQAIAEKEAADAQAAKEAAEQEKAEAIQKAAEEKAEADKEAAGKVIAKIDEISEIEQTNECENSIVAARSAYDALTDEQKQLVTNYEKLVKAETEYSMLPQTGYSGIHKVFAGFAALIGMAGIGLAKKRRKEDEE